MFFYAARGDSVIKKEMIAMLLAGGQGSRLGVLTQKVAKPAVSFGGKYRIIDFPLSNCINSGIDTVGVLTQYQPLELNTYIANGQPWDLDRTNGGVFVLPPYTSAEKGEWYKGTANAIYQNLGFMEQFNPKYVIILSGDHIYKMDYNKMLSVHKKANADAQVSKLKTKGFDAFVTTNGGGTAASGDTPKKSNTEIAKEVIAGKWGNGACLLYTSDAADEL